MSGMRLIRDPAAEGAWNMAVDEALLETAATTGLATLRFYEWHTPTLSLGYFQAASDRAQHAASRDCPLVRRASGGGAIVHDRELTYSIAVPERDVRSRRSAALYDAVHRSLIDSLAEFGIAAALHGHRPAAALHPSEPFLCFQRRASGDVVVDGHKIAGSAQRRRKGAVLQHGSLLLARSAAAPELPGMHEITGSHVDLDTLVESWTSRLASELALQFMPGTMAEDELRNAATLRESRFGAAEYALRR